MDQNLHSGKINNARRFTLKGKKIISVFLIALLTMSAVFAGAVTEVPGPKHIVILETTDIHGNVWGYSYEDMKETTDDGMVRLYDYIKSVRNEGDPVILLDCGDYSQGTVMTDDIYNKNSDLRNPIVAAMNFMQYDAATLGNHEFNFGTTTLKKIAQQANFPVLAANVVDKDGLFITGKGWVIKNIGGVKVAVIGVVTPDIPIWDASKQGIENYTYIPGNIAVKDAIEKIGDDADMIVVAAHMGMHPEFDKENGGDSAQKILDDNPQINALLVGHSHVIISEKQGKTVIGGCRNLGSDIARFDFWFSDDNTVIDSTVQVIDMKDRAVAEEIRQIPAVAEAQQKAINLVTGSGSSDSPEGGSYLGVTTRKFQPENEIRGIPEGRLRPTAVISLINKVQLDASGADVSGTALFKNASDLPEGGIIYGNIFDIYKFDNTIYRVTVTGAELKAWMEWSAECFNQWKPGDINISFNPERYGSQHDIFSGVDYELDLSQPKGSRVKNVMFKGHKLKDDETLTIAVNNYRYSSALKALNLISGEREWESSCSVRDMLVLYFKENSPVDPASLEENNWKIINDLSRSDPRRAEIIRLINEGKLPTPYNESYNLNEISPKNL